jgi:two-component system, OmpR family, sensor histidine kinase QseC
VNSVADAANSEAAVATRKLPSFARRIAATVLGAVVVLFLLLYTFISFRDWFSPANDFDRSLLAVAKSVAQTLDTLDSDESARAATTMLRLSLIALGELDESDLPLHVLVAKRDGTLRFAPTVPAQTPASQGGGRPQREPTAAVVQARLATAQAAATVDVLAQPDGFGKQSIQNLTLHLYTASSEHWRVVLLDNADARSRWFLWILFQELAGYLGVALVLIVVPAWWAARQALAPLRRLSDEVAVRGPNDTRALTLQPSHRELQPLHSALNRLFEKLTQGVARERAFVSDAAHELRTPLAVIATQAHVLAQADGDARPEAALRLQGAVSRASHLSHQLLQLAQSDTLLARPQQTADAMDIVRDVMASLTDRAQAQGSELSLHGPDSLVLPTDARALHSIVDNLLDNALRYGGPGVTVETHVLLEPDAWRLRVADDGPGLKPEQRERAFERFWRADTGRAPGAGLGLAIVREAARSLGGSVRIDVGLNSRGCGVVVVMPRAPSSAKLQVGSA